MKRFLFGMAMLSLLAVPTAARAQGSLEVVQKAKADLQAQGVDLSGPCGAFRITNLVAWRLRPAYGFLVKKGGNRAIVRADGSCVNGDNPGDGYATDYLINRTTFFGYDILGDGGGANVPQDFNTPETDPDMVNRNRANFAEPFDWGIVVGPHDPPPPPPATVDLGPVNARIDALQNRANALEANLATLDRTLQATRAILNTVIAGFENRIGALEARPTVSSCTAAANLGAFRIPISCKLQ